MGAYLSKWQGKQVIVNGRTTWQYHLDLPRLRAERPDLKFLYVKGTQGSTGVDPLYEKHRRVAEAAGFAVGVFHYLTNDKPASEQARHFWNVCGGTHHGLTLIQSGDVEDPAHLDKLNADFVYAFLSECDALWGARTIPYTRQTFWDPYVRRSKLPRGNTSPDPRFAGRQWWVAHYNKHIRQPWLPADAPDYAIWQIGETGPGELPGVPAPTKFTLERLNPRLTLADLSYVKVAPPPVAPPAAVIPVPDMTTLYDNLCLMLTDFGKHGRVAPYQPIGG
jgi:GH25 family lysozyme M1 (1,4-beta-N-acetylmuramidase)